MSNLVKQEHWEDFKHDDIVGIEGERGTRYRFLEYVKNLDTGTEWVNLFGGNPGMGPQLRGRTQGFRAVPPEKLRKV